MFHKTNKQKHKHMNNQMYQLVQKLNGESVKGKIKAEFLNFLANIQKNSKLLNEIYSRLSNTFLFNAYLIILPPIADSWDVKLWSNLHGETPPPSILKSLYAPTMPVRDRKRRPDEDFWSSLDVLVWLQISFLIVCLGYLIGVFG